MKIKCWISIHRIFFDWIFDNNDRPFLVKSSGSSYLVLEDKIHQSLLNNSIKYELKETLSFQNDDYNDWLKSLYIGFENEGDAIWFKLMWLCQ